MTSNHHKIKPSHPEESDSPDSSTPLTRDTTVPLSSEDSALATEETAELPPEDPRDVVLAQLTKEVEEKNQQLQEMTNRYHRALADYDNLNKRMTVKIQSARMDGIADFIKKFLAVIDTFESALRQMEESKIDKKVMDGFQMLFFQFYDTLEKEGLKAIPAKGVKFDPNCHEAVARGSQDGIDDEIVLTEYEKGYMFKDRVLRPTKVVINAK
ncbi:MAG: nucleotide exchange factor GrpE [Candidatus Riflebacteria bacterium]|nr:nucleotide exchange factor GrpE [Candidatus Riflebacteria bacterium]